MEADWTAIETETIERLRALIRFDTTNPPGNELPAARYLVDELAEDGIESTLLEPVPGRAAVLARLTGNGKGRPVMLMAHMDVVGVEREKWTHDPFGGAIEDGYLYGRGAIDDKGMLAVNLMVMSLLKRLVVDRGEELERDVVFLATSDEEAGGEHGIRWLVNEHRELLDAEFAINEGGRIRIIEGGQRYVAIQTAEKISHMVRLTAKGPAGHASIPLAGNAVLRLGRALARLAEHAEPVILMDTTRRFFEGLSKIWPVREEGEAMALLVSADPAKSAEGARRMTAMPVLDALIRNGISATSVKGGVGSNVIPAEASALLNVRTVPGSSIDDVVARIAAAVADPDVEIEVTARGEDAPESDGGSAFYSALAAAAHHLDPDMTVVPYLSTGATDSSHLRRIGIDAYGILPFPMEPVDEKRMHGHDERVPVAGVHFGTRLILEAVRRIAAPGAAAAVPPVPRGR